MRSALTAERLRALLDYNDEIGVFNWLVRAQGRRMNRPAGTFLSTSGYRYIRVGDYQYSEHRLAWLYVHGEWPKGEIDHINGDKIDNRIANLRDVPHAVNCKNKAARKNASGVTGVYQSGHRFYAMKTEAGRNYTIGSFTNIEDAIEARLAYQQANGFTERHGL